MCFSEGYRISFCILVCARQRMPLCPAPDEYLRHRLFSEHAWQIFCMWQEELIHPKSLLAGTLGPVTSPLGPLPLLAWCCIH